SAYSIRTKHMNKESAQDHVDVGRFCATYGLHTSAVSHLREAIALDPARRSELEREIGDVRSAAASALFQKAKDIIDGDREKEFNDAAQALHKILDEYFDTPYGEEARKLDDALARKIRDHRDKRDKELEKKEEDRKTAERDKQVREPVVKLEAGLDEIRKLWHDGLDYEGAGSGAKALQPWQLAEQKLITGKLAIDQFRKKSKEPDLIAKLGELDKAHDLWLVRLYFSLSRLYLADNFDVVSAMRWCNKGLKIDPDHELLNKLKLTITELAIKARIESTPTGR
ncbi:MAG TPA: hypothetical protein VI643_05185, partial [Planctomycetota bacterium]|nr:hypothetical protein [Planctomycetota bacterium]